MPQSEQLEVVVLGSGTGGKLIAWHMAQSGRRTAVVERHWVGGSCPNIACMPSKNEISSAKVAQLARQGGDYGTVTGSVTVDMATVRRRKREMVERQVAKHLQIYRASGAELILGSGRFVASKTLEVNLNDGGKRELSADKVFLNVGTRAAIPNVPGLVAAQPLTHVEVLELDHLPQHLIVIGGGYSGLELAQAYRRFGSDVTIVESGPQLWLARISTSLRKCGEFSPAKVSRFLSRPSCSRYAGDRETRLRLARVHPRVSIPLTAAISWSPLAGFRIPPELD